MIVSTKDGISCEIQHSDMAYPPGQKGGLSLNTGCCWFRKEGGTWIRSQYRGSIYVINALKSNTYDEALKMLSADPVV